MEVRVHCIVFCVLSALSIISIGTINSAQFTGHQEGIWPAAPALASLNSTGQSNAHNPAIEYAPGPQPPSAGMARSDIRTKSGQGTYGFSALLNPISRAVFGNDKHTTKSHKGYTPPPGCVPMAPSGDSF